MRVLFDTNILLDYVLNREPFSEDAMKVFECCGDGKIEGFVAAHSYPNMFYVLRKTINDEVARKTLNLFCGLFETVPIDGNKIVKSLLQTNFRDFEDCLQAECAKEIGADYIVSRNKKDFVESEVKCIDAKELNELFC